jgi:hypothetical protein
MAAALLAVTGCGKQLDPDRSVSAGRVLAMDPSGEDPTAATVGDGMLDITSTDVRVTFAHCSAEAYEPGRGMSIRYEDTYGHRACRTILLDHTAELLGFDREDLTATATVVVEAQLRIQPEFLSGIPVKVANSEIIKEVQIGPLHFGEEQQIGPLSHRFPLHELAEGEGLAGYSFHVKVSDCRLSNGSVCGNNSVVLLAVYPEIGSSGRGLSGDRPRLEPGQQAGGLPLVEPDGSGDAREPATGGPVGDHPLALVEGVPADRTVGAVYRAGDGIGRVAFYGAELAAPLDVASAGAAVAQAVLAAALPANGAYRPTSEPQQHDAGGSDAVVWCQTLELTLLGGTSHSCAWVDQWTVGLIVVNSHAVADLDLTAPDAAALLVAMRADIEVTP